MSMVIAGRIVPLSELGKTANPEKESFQGKVWLNDSGRVELVTQGNAAGPSSGFEGATHVDVDTSLVVPGFVDLHSHLAYATLPLWTEAGRREPYLHHNSWPGAATYAADITWPAYAFIEAAPQELLAYAEIRALIGGTTSIQGSPPKNRPLDSWLVRNVEDETFGGTVASNQVLSSTLTLDAEKLARRAAQMKNGATFIYHCAEGQVNSIVQREYEAVRRCGCLQGGFIAIHANALNPGDFNSWTEPGAVVWSPFSNLWLYGSTTDVASALSKNIKVCVGSDWGPSGTRNVLGELKVASLVSDSKGWKLSSFDLVRMITCVPGDALSSAWGVQSGRLQPGALGDVIVIKASKKDDPFDKILAATEKDIQLVVVAGRARYGTTALMESAKAVHRSPLKVCGEDRSLSLSRLDDKSKAWSFTAIVERMKEVRTNPKKEINAAKAARAASAVSGKPPRLRLALDMPLGRLPTGGLPKDLGEIVVPPLQPLEHDSAFFESIKDRGFHAGLLDGLAKFYS